MNEVKLGLLCVSSKATLCGTSLGALHSEQGFKSTMALSQMWIESVDGNGGSKIEWLKDC